MKQTTSRIELVETGNLALCLKRLRSSAGGYDDGRWKRALYHALAMSHVANNYQLEVIRKALELP